jgi:hypothetical protein
MDVQAISPASPFAQGGCALQRNNRDFNSSASAPRSGNNELCLIARRFRSRVNWPCFFGGHEKHVAMAQVSGPSQLKAASSAWIVNASC